MEKTTIRQSLPEVILLIVSTISCILSLLSAFLYYHYGELTFKFPDGFTLIQVIIMLLPRILLLLYITKYGIKNTGSVLLPISFGLLAFSPVYSLFMNAVVYESYIHWSHIMTLVLTLIPFGFLAFVTRNGLKEKLYTLIVSCIGLALQGYNTFTVMVSAREFIVRGSGFFAFTNAMGVVSSICMYIALLLYVLRSDLPLLPDKAASKGKEGAKQQSPADALQLLKEKYELGILTEEDYNVQRAEIIRKL